MTVTACEGECARWERLEAKADSEINYFTYEDQMRDAVRMCNGQGGVD